ncbi:MAG: prolyl aminopeptidase [Pseudomonadota bacterium]
MRQLYPSINHNRELNFDVGNGHRIYGREYGSEDGIPVVFLHGGPGSGCEPYHARFFDPEKYRIILFDQRGAGRSTPHASLEHNTTQHLVADIEQIRDELGVDKWLVFGGSWGSTLALVYAQTHPERVAGLVLRGIFLCRREDVRWFYQHGAHHLFPDYWSEYWNHIPEDERGDMVAAYHRRLTGADEIARMAAAKIWSMWEGRTATLSRSSSVQEHFADPHVALSLARIECDYFYHGCWLEPDQILRDAPRLHDIPGVIVHGRYDVVCPIKQAFDLHAVWPQAELQIIPDAGHAASEPGIASALVHATDDFARKLA